MKRLFLLQIFSLLSFVQNNPVEIYGELYGVAILPCSFTPGDGEAIHWTIGDSNGAKVHSYYEGKDHLEDQDQTYKGRTSLFLDQIRNGNASLRLQDLQKSDANKYFCYVGTKEQRVEFTMLLKVEDTPDEIFGELYGVAILPCSLPPGNGEVIHWTIGDSNGPKVHSYYEGKDQLHNQDQTYKGRTSLYLDQIRNGNASLQLRNLQKNDENKYFCYAATTEKHEEFTVSLKVVEFGHSMEYAVDNLKCYSRLDDVNIVWYDGEHEKPNNNSSSCTFCDLKNNLSSYKCIIRHSKVQTTWTGMWQRKAATQDKIECACTLCKTGITEMSVRLYIQNDTTKIPVASINSSGLLDISEPYQSRISGNPSEYSLHFNNLTANDRGDYICEIRIPNETQITLISFNISDSEEMQKKHRWPILGSFLLVVLLFVFVWLQSHREVPVRLKLPQPTPSENIS